MKEQLVFEARLDLGQFNSQLNQVKNTVSNVNKQINSSLTASTASSKSTKDTQHSLDSISATIKNVGNQLQGMKGMSLFDVGATILGLKAVTEGFKKMKDTKLEKIGFTLSGSIEEAKDKLEGFFQSSGKGSAGFVFGDADTMKKYSETMSKFADLQDKLGEAVEKGSFKQLKVLKTEMEGLGLNTKGTTHTIKDMAKSMGLAKTAALAFAGALAGAALVLAPIAIIGTVAALRISKLGDEIYHSASKFGFSTKAYQEWSYVMERSGSTIEDLKGYLETLGSEQAAVITGSEEAAQKFKNLGISAEEAVSMDSQTLFETTVAKLQGIENATERSAYAYELFGDEASRLMNVLSLNNVEMQKAMNNYHLLGGAMSGELLQSSNSLQNSIANMKQAWQGISNTIAQVFIPIVQAVVNWLTKAFVVVNLFLKSLFGLDLTASAKTTDKAASSTGKYTGGLKAAKKAAEELKRVTMGFDELNIVSNPNKGSADTSADAGSGSVSGLGGGAAIDTSFLEAGNLNLEGIYAWFEKYKTLIRDISAYVLVAIGLVGGLAALFTGNFILAGALFALGGLGIAIGAGDGGTWDKLFGKLKAIWDKMAPVFQPVIDFFKGAWADIRVMFADAWEFIKRIWNDCQPFFKVIVWGIKQYFYDLQMTFEIIWGVVVEIVRFAAVVIAAALELCWTKIKAKWSVVINFFKAIWDTISLGAGIVKDLITGNFEAAGEKLKTIGNSWVRFFKSIVTGICDVFKGIGTFFGDIFKGAFNGVIGIVEKAVNAIIKRINKLSWKIPDWVPKIGGGKFGFNFSEISIPRLATGGIATRSTIANIGEAGKEAILPLESNTGWMDALADKIAERNGGPTKIVLQVGEKELGWATINSINNITKQTGNIQLEL